MHRNIFLFLLCVKSVFCANILYISPVPSPSHHIWNRALAFGLAQKGHNVTLIGPDKDKVLPANYSHIYLEGAYDDFHDSVDMIEMSEYGPTKIISEFVNFCLIVCKSEMRSTGIKQLLSYPPDFKFDLIVIDITTGSCLYPLIHHFSYPPTVGVTPFLLPAYIAFNFGNHLYPNYIPWYGLPYTQSMSFMERFWNLLYTYGETAYKNIEQYKEEHKEAKKLFGDDIPSMEQIERQINLVLTNTDPILDQPVPLAPNFVAVGGLHTRESKEIPKDLQQILDNAKSGVIVFSLGSNVRSDMLDKKIQKALLEAFAKLSEIVVWKFESAIENLPKNVIVRKWLLQNDILGHPNVKLFIGHGGALSTQEAMFHGVPMICVPFFMDQLVNTRNVVERKLGISLNYRLITSDYVYGKIREILDNNIYTKNMKELSRTFRDRIDTPLERAIFWSEYAMRHKGAAFLNSAARDLPFYKASGLDVVSFLVAIVVVLFYLFSKLLIKFFSLFEDKQKIKIN